MTPTLPASPATQDEALKPRPYNLADDREMLRLLRELRGYMHVSLKEGTDRQGRQFALDALVRLTDGGEFERHRSSPSSAWRDIKDAPKDATRILTVYSLRGLETVVAIRWDYWWGDPKWGPGNGGTEYPIKRWMRDNGDEFYNPVYWRPFPNYPESIEMTKPVPDFMIWHCAGCGAAAVGKTKPCACPTNVGHRDGPNGKRESTWWDAPLSDYVPVPRELLERILRARGGFNELMELETLIDAGKP